MKISFSTLGCPGWSFDEIYATAKDLGMDGIEIRGIKREMYAPKAIPFKPKNIEETLEKLKRSHISIAMLTSEAELGLKKKAYASVKEAKAYIDFAERVGCEYVRVLCENAIFPSGELDRELLIRQYREVLDYARGKNVYPLMETNGPLADSRVMRDFINEIDRDNAFVLWDIHHPFRVFSENAAYTAENLRGLVKYVHVKDSAIENGEVKYRMMGYGDVPILDCLRILNNAGYDSYISFEWLKRWQPDLSEPGIVFAHFMNYMTYLMRQL
ncbi:MAG: sugar phosphate isomerase/epimerase [Clostridia bacterium]|nr:sugar phosphate isomerase/epimerase [Clostridia bacterium]